MDSDREKREFDLAKRLGTHPGLVGRAYNRPRLEDLGKAGSLEGLEEAAGQAKVAYKELGQRIEREKKLGVMQGKMEARRHLQNKRLKPSKVVKPETKDSAPILRWPTERRTEGSKAFDCSFTAPPLKRWTERGAATEISFIRRSNVYTCCS